jgi:hypothetical protein
VILTFLAGMLCGAALLIAFILVSDRSFLDLITGRLVDDDSAERLPSVAKPARSLAVGK